MSHSRWAVLRNTAVALLVAEPADHAGDQAPVPVPRPVTPGPEVSVLLLADGTKVIGSVAPPARHPLEHRRRLPALGTLDGWTTEGSACGWTLAATT